MKKLLTLLLLSSSINASTKIDYAAMAQAGIKKAREGSLRLRKYEYSYSPFLRLDDPYAPQPVSTERPKSTKSQVNEMKRRQKASKEHANSLLQRQHDARAARSNTPRDPYTPPQGVVGRPKSTESQVDEMKRRQKASKEHVEFLMGLKSSLKPVRGHYTPHEVRRPKSKDRQLALMRKIRQLRYSSSNESTIPNVPAPTRIKHPKLPLTLGGAYTPPQGAVKRPQTTDPKLVEREKNWK